MNVCIVTNGDLSRPTGVARYWRHLHGILVRARIPVRVVLPAESGSMRDAEIAVGAPQALTAIPPAVGAIAVQHGAPQAHLDRDPSWRAGASTCKAHQLLAARPNTEWVSCSHWAAAENERAFGIKARRIIYGCVDTDSFRPGPRQQQCNAARPVVLHHCADSNKGEGRIGAVAEALGNAFEVRRLRCAQDEVPDAMRNADIWLCLSVSEGLPTVVQEALATDMVVVSTNVGVLGTPETVAATGATAFNWQLRGHASVVAGHVRAAWEKRARRTGRAYALAHWALPHFESQWLDCINEAILTWGKA